MLLKIHFFFILSIYRDYLFIRQISKYIDYKKNILKIQYTYTYDRNNFFIFLFFFLTILCNKFDCLSLFFFFFWKISLDLWTRSHDVSISFPFRVTTRAKKRCIVAILPRMPAPQRLQRTTRISTIPPRKRGPT